MVASNTKQVKSRERVQQHGEVFTNEREVNAMLDLVKHETERIDSRFLEPACGDGNFLAEILRRKLQVCRNFVEQGKNTQLEYEKNAVLAVSSIYGIELLMAQVAYLNRQLFGRKAEKLPIYAPNYPDMFADQFADLMQQAEEKRDEAVAEVEKSRSQVEEVMKVQIYFM